jgi:hypothetical protein
MKEVRFLFDHFGALLVLALLAYTFGRRLTFHFVFQTRLEEICVSIGLGFGVIAYLVLLLGCFNLLYVWIVAGVLAAAFLVCYRVWGGVLLSFYRPWDLLKRAKKLNLAIRIAVVLVVTIIARPIWLFPLYPPTAFDSTMYHLATAKVYAERHALPLTPYLRLATSPQTNHMLFTLSLLFFDDVLAQLVQFLILLTLAGSMIAFGQRFFSDRAGVWSAAILLSNPLVLWLGSVCYIDIAVMLFLWLSIFAFYVWTRSTERKWLLLSAAFCGFAIGTKYNAMIFLLILGILALYKGGRERKFRDCLFFVAFTLLVVSPWFARNFFYTRNPVYPFFYKVFGSLFGYGFLRAEYYHGMLSDVANYGVGVTVKSFLLLPWYLATQHQRFASEMPVAWLPLFVLPLVLVIGLVAPRMRLLVAIGLPFILFWFFTIQVMRYLMPVLPLLSVLTAAILDRLFSYPPIFNRQIVARAITIIGFVALIYTGWDHSYELVANQGATPVDQEQRDSYLSRSFPSYPAYKLLNQYRKSDYNLYSIYDENLAYFVDGFYMGDYFGPARYALIFDKLSDGRLLHEQLKQLHVDYLLINYRRETVVIPNDDVFRQYFRLIYSRDNVDVLELR